MTRDEAMKTMIDRVPVIYTGKGSMGRPTRMIGKITASFRGSPSSIGIITDIKRTTAIVRSYGIAGGIYPIKDLKIVTDSELRAAKAYNKLNYPNLKFYY